jgi:integrase
MSQKPKIPTHTGRTEAGNTRDVKVERIGKVTVYKRGETYTLYYREGGISQRKRIDGNLAVARATAHKIQNALDEGKRSPVSYSRTSPEKMITGYLDSVANVQRLAIRTQDRYRAALDRFLGFCQDFKIVSIDTVRETTVEEFVKWLRGQRRTRNGASRGQKDNYKVGGVRFILSTCRTAFRWAGRHRLLPPFTENPFFLFPIEKLKDSREVTGTDMIFTAAQEASFFSACSPWQQSIFGMLATYGLRVGELTHLLVEDVDFANDTFVIRSKPWLFWSVKTGRERRLPLLPGTKEIVASAIGDRKAGFVFLKPNFCDRQNSCVRQFPNPQAFRTYIESLVAEHLATRTTASEKEQRKVAVTFCRNMGQIPEKRVRDEFIKVTTEIGAAEFTRAHDLRHLFSSRAQAAGVNPILVQEMLGHSTLDMTKRYTHLGMDTKREALKRIVHVVSSGEVGEEHGAKATEAAS